MANASGPGAITPDGSPVDFYLQLPTTGQPELIHANVPPGASILDLGAGVGRIANPLAALGHRVVAVDDSPEMLAHIQAAEPVLSKIEDLNLTERFDAVLMASHLANVPEPAARHALFATARRHVTGVVLCEWSTPEWFDGLRPGRGEPHMIGPVVIRVDVHSLVDGVIDATAEYRVDDVHWAQPFRARRFDNAELAAELAVNGLTLDRFLTDDHRWFTARPS